MMQQSSTQDTSPGNCPLCGRPNACAMASAASDATECWCHSRRIPPELLRKLPQASRGRACICQACIEKGRC